MITLLCSYCLGPIEDFDDLEFDEYGNDFHVDCPRVVNFETDLDDEVA